MVGQAGQPFPLSKGALLISCWKICDMRTKKVSRNKKDIDLDIDIYVIIIQGQHDDSL